MNPSRTLLPPPVVFLHGLDGSPPGHWQSWLSKGLLADGYPVHEPAFPSPERPDLLEWMQHLHGLLTRIGDRSTIVAHSLGAYLWLHYASRIGSIPAARVLLVAPPGPAEIRKSRRISRAFETPLCWWRIHEAADEILMVGSYSDPNCRKGFVSAYADPLRITYIPLGKDAGHINLASGYGPWPLARRWVMRTPVRCRESRVAQTGGSIVPEGISDRAETVPDGPGCV